MSSGKWRHVDITMSERVIIQLLRKMIRLCDLCSHLNCGCLRCFREKLINRIEHHKYMCIQSQGAVSIRKTVLLGMVIPMLKIRRPTDRLIFNMGIPIPGKTVFYIETGPRQLCTSLTFCNSFVPINFIHYFSDYLTGSGEILRKWQWRKNDNISTTTHKSRVYILRDILYIAFKCNRNGLQNTHHISYMLLTYIYNHDMISKSKFS